MPLDDLNPKQRKKDFKTKSKQIRSKDIAIRSQALDAVFDDPRYLIEGELLLPFLETIASSKVFHAIYVSVLAPYLYFKCIERFGVYKK
jgi:hypothetical protein